MLCFYSVASVNPSPTPVARKPKHDSPGSGMKLAVAGLAKNSRHAQRVLLWTWQFVRCCGVCENLVSLPEDHRLGMLTKPRHEAATCGGFQPWLNHGSAPRKKQTTDQLNQGHTTKIPPDAIVPGSHWSNDSSSMCGSLACCLLVRIGWLLSCPNMLGRLIKMISDSKTLGSLRAQCALADDNDCLACFATLTLTPKGKHCACEINQEKWWFL